MTVDPTTAEAAGSARRRTSMAFAGAVSVGLLVLLFSLVDAGEVWAAVRSASPGLIAAVLVAHICAIVPRIARWRCLLAGADCLVVPEASAPAAHRWLIADAVFIGWLVNLVIPARLGDLGRPVVYARRTGGSAARVLATVAVERALDLAALAVLGAAALASIPEVADRVISPTAAAAGTGVVAIGLLVLAGALARHAPAVDPAAEGTGAIRRSVGRFLEGLGAVQSPRMLGAAAALSAVIWAAETAAVLLAMRSVGVDLGWGAAAALVFVTTISITLLTGLGGLGVEQGAAAAVLVPLGVEPAAAVALGFVLTLTADLWIVPGGLIGLWRQSAARTTS